MIDVTDNKNARRSNELQEIINRRVYQRSGVESNYSHNTLTVSETAALLRYQPAFYNKRILDVGVGTGRTAKFLAPLAERYLGIDFSQPMLGEATGRCPGVEFKLLDMREVATLGKAQFDFVFAPNNVIDATSGVGRERFFQGAFEILAPRGVLIFSSHNLSFGEAFGGPRLHGSRNPVRLARNLQQFARQVVNHRRVRRHRRVEADYAILNDSGHDYSLLHYYIDRYGQEQQLASAGFDLLSIFDNTGAVLGDDAVGHKSSSLMYVASRRD